MPISNISQQLYGAFTPKKQDNPGSKKDAAATAQQAAQADMAAESQEAASTYDLTQMTSGDMLALADTLREQGDERAFLTLAVFSARAALEDHPDPQVRNSWITPKNEDGTFNLLAEILSPIHLSTGTPELDQEQVDDFNHLLDTLRSLPASLVKQESSSIDIKL